MRRTLGAVVVVGRRNERVIYTLSFSPFNGGQEDSHSENPAPHLHNLGTQRANTSFYYYPKQIKLTAKQCDQITKLRYCASFQFPINSKIHPLTGS